MDKLLDIASKVSTPLGLAGLALTILFLTLRHMIGSGKHRDKILSALPAGSSYRLTYLIVNRLFFLSISAMVLGFIGYVASLYAEKHIPLKALPLKISLHAGHIFCLPGRGVLLGALSDESAKEERGLMGISVTVTNASDREVLIENPMVEFGPGSRFQAAGFPMQASDFLQGGRSVIKPGFDKQFPLYQGLMDKDFDPMFREWAAGRAKSVYVETADGIRSYAPKEDIQQAIAYIKAHIQEGDLSVYVSNCKEKWASVP